MIESYDPNKPKSAVVLENYAYSSGGYRTISLPLSDELRYHDARSNYEEKYIEDHLIMKGRSNKNRLIEKWAKTIDKMNAQITTIKENKTLSDEAKQRKIERRISIIIECENNIKNTWKNCVFTPTPHVLMLCKQHIK